MSCDNTLQSSGADKSLTSIATQLVRIRVDELWGIRDVEQWCRHVSCLVRELDQDPRGALSL